MINVEDEELKYYLGQAADHYDEVEENFSQEENNLFPDFKAMEGSGQEMPEGFWGMVFEVIYDAIRADKLRHKQFKKHDYIESLIVGMLTYRKENMEPAIKENYTLYKVSVIAGFIAHKVFELIPEHEGYSNEQYYSFTKRSRELVQSNYPELFK